MLSHVDPHFADISCPHRDRVFSPLEWLVIALGARPGSVPLSLSPFGRALLGMMGGEIGDASQVGPETLRRTAGVALRCGWGMPAIEVGAFLRAGFTEEQLEVLIESVGPAPCENARRPFDLGRGERLPESRSAGSTTMMEMH